MIADPTKLTPVQLLFKRLAEHMKRCETDAQLARPTIPRSGTPDAEAVAHYLTLVARAEGAHAAYIAAINTRDEKGNQLS